MFEQVFLQKPLDKDLFLFFICIYQLYLSDSLHNLCFRVLAEIFKLLAVVNCYSF